MTAGESFLTGIKPTSRPNAGLYQLSRIAGQVLISPREQGYRVSIFWRLDVDHHIPLGRQPAEEPWPGRHGTAR